MEKEKSLLDLYTDYLICSFGPTTATGLSRVLDGEISHDQVTRFLSAPAKTSADLWRVVKPLLRQIETEAGVLVIDDSIEEKPYTDENELICWHWDSAKERTVKGINFLTAFYVAQEARLPVAFDLVTKTETFTDPKTGNEKRRSTISKNERFRMLLHICLHNEIRFRYVAADVWYASADNMKYIHHQLDKRFVFPLKANRKVALCLEDKLQGRYLTVSRLDLSAGTTREVWLEEVDFPVLLAKQVFTNEDGSTGTRYLVTDDLTLTFDQLTALYQKRWSVEVYHKSLKQNASLEKSPTRTETTQRNHLFASLCAYIKLESLKLQTGLNHFALKSKIYLSAVQTAFIELGKFNPQSLTA
jgi:hypothetical protein